ncbi:unnamed protein product, partial [Nippostrongylus brasiliensis]|uniref:Lipase_3 domain-containing protein n=1 Tax=Nippostrongylus brasiliensis TaxID=27835 RepID=A0A0N4YWI9_NIPBR
ITLTGHSLGGALAALAAARIAKQGFRSGDQITMYTFGEPRVGDLTFATNFDSMIKNSYRVVFGRDSIPHLPPCKKDPSWSGEEGDSRPCDANAKGTPYHHSTEIWYPDSMEPGSHYDECLGQPIGEDFTCSNKFAFSSHPEQIESYILDHAHYFTVPVPQYGEVGCDHTQAGSLSLSDYIPDNLSNFLRF